ncbi:hypothetical protein HOLleu_17541 [Holothuria leucospilota]|uniref:Uncharacterized protein n=1 Tax=Holothuria leucospilota TaxID=206669 RepID=A0A9Q1H8D9_HOLLE|nr:hypothetical protein HOLleu_17541 [Holothuria leucospilota]
MRPEYSQVSDFLKLVFIHVPMTGGNAIETSPLFLDEQDKLGGHYLGGHHKISAFTDPAFQKYHKFGMVRHPCSRLISVWQYFLKRMGNDEDNAWVAKFFNDTTLASFDMFVDALFARGVSFIESESHLQTQVGMIFDEDKRFGLDQLLVYEKWNESLEELGKILKVDAKVFHSIEKPVRDQHVCKGKYTPITWSKVRTLYAMDFCVLGYSMDRRKEDIVPPLGLTSDILNIRYKECRVKGQTHQTSLDQIDDSHVNSTADDTKCTIYTYFQKDPNAKPENVRVNDETLSLWRNVWSSAGWRPQILTEEDAKRHPSYEELRQKFWELPTINTKEYELACFMRYVAMAAVGGGWMSDYDVIPYRLTACIEPLNDGAFTIYDNRVPSLVSGSSREFTRVANLMANIDWKSQPKLFSVNDKPHVSDMYCQVKFVEDELVTSMRVVIGPHVLFESPFTCNRTNGQFTFDSIPAGLPKLPWAIHFSHHSVSLLRKSNFTHLGNQSVELKRTSRPDFMKIANNFLQENCV